MNWLVYHVASGQAFFIGTAMVILAVAASARASPVTKRVVFPALVLGAVEIAISSTPIPGWYYTFAVAVTLSWIVLHFVGKYRRAAAGAAVAVWLIAVALELPYHAVPTLKPAPERSLTVIGDSLTAGIGDDDTSERWPTLLAREHHLEVQDLSHMGDTIARALERLGKRPITSPVVLLEIGGNDLLGSTPPTRFARDMDALLAQVTAGRRQVIMFELPLPPFYHRYGRIQRRLARKHHVALLPKRMLLSVLSTRGATLDTIHLSQAGHRQMAQCVWRAVCGAFPEHDDT